jgi:uncharacterized protein (TIGR02246 family)
MAMTALSADRRDFIRNPTNRVVGTVGDAARARAAAEALVLAGCRAEDIDILHGEEDVHRLDPTGAEHGFFAQFQRTVIRTFELEEFRHLTHHVDDLRAGRYVIMVLARRREQRLVISDILHQHGAEFVGFYGRWAWTDLPADGHNSPSDIPGLFARAWNTGDPDALASLFDEDAEFVDVSGLCWHDRESIRKAHADGWQRIFNKSTLATDGTKVKQLSPDIAIVHARMTCAQAGMDGAPQPGPRTTIASFVVHRTGDRWLCASVHNTDVTSSPATNPIDEARGH